MERNASGASASTEIAALEAEIAEFSRLREACLTREKELRAREDPAQDVFYASEIFELTRERLRLDVEIDLRRKKIRRRELGYADPGPDQGPRGGFVF
jgi:hypothetical protein